MYFLQAKNTAGELVANKELGSWRDNAREQFGTMKRRMIAAKCPGTLVLIDHAGVVELKHIQT